MIFQLGVAESYNCTGRVDPPVVWHRIGRPIRVQRAVIIWQVVPLGSPVELFLLHPVRLGDCLYPRKGRYNDDTKNGKMDGTAEKPDDERKLKHKIDFSRKIRIQAGVADDDI